MLECWDREEQDYVAVNVIRNVKKYHQAAMIEARAPRARVLQRLQRAPAQRARIRRAFAAARRLERGPTKDPLVVRARPHTALSADVAAPRQIDVLEALKRGDPGRQWCAAALPCVCLTRVAAR